MDTNKDIVINTHVFISSAIKGREYLIMQVQVGKQVLDGLKYSMLRNAFIEKFTDTFPTLPLKDLDKLFEFFYMEIIKIKAKKNCCFIQKLNLSGNELILLRLAAEGAGLQESAKFMDKSIHRIKQYRSSIIEKLHAKGFINAVAHAIKHNLIEYE